MYFIIAKVEKINVQPCTPQTQFYHNDNVFTDKSR